MDGYGEYFTKLNKLVGERQLLYDLTYKRNLMNKTNKQAKQNQRHGNKEQTDSDHSEGNGGKGGKKRKGLVKGRV